MTGFIPKTLTLEGKTFRYVVHLPPQFSPEKKWPVLLSLHGAVACGTDNEKQTQLGIGLALRKTPDLYPALVVLPQCPQGQNWAGLWGEAALAALDAVIHEYNGDPARQYLSGWSLGGEATWGIGGRHPHRFAALVPISWAVNPQRIAEALWKVPIWIFHGGADPVVPPERVRALVQALRSGNHPNLHYTEYPNGQHRIAAVAYAEPKLLEWLMAQHT